MVNVRIVQGSGNAHSRALIALLMVLTLAACISSVRPPRPEGPHAAAAATDPAGPRGLHYTPEELVVWRDRARSGPYRVRGDVSPHSPADWARIVASTDDFVEAPSRDRWNPEWGPGPVPTTTGDRTYVPDPGYTTRVRDAAFYALVAEDEDIADGVIQELLAQARTPAADLGDRTRFPAGKGRVRDTNPYFMTASALTTLLFAADYVKGWATPVQQAELRQWHREGAEWLFPDMVQISDRRFADRSGGDYTPRLRPNNGKPGFLGGPPTTVYGRDYNNRGAVLWLYIGLVGIDQDVLRFQEQAQQFFREWLAYAVYPDSGSYRGRSWSGGGWLAELERMSTQGFARSDLGWSYANDTLNTMGTLADHFARAGDPGLYRYSTRKGLYGTEAASNQEPKSLLFALRAMARHTNGEIRRYGTLDAERIADDAYLIDGYNPNQDWVGADDVAYAVMNLYYDDPLLREVALRQGSRVRPYPPDPAENARGLPWQGHHAIYPAVLFQTAGLEERVDPYGGLTTGSASAGRW